MFGRKIRTVHLLMAFLLLVGTFIYNVGSAVSSAEEREEDVNEISWVLEEHLGEDWENERLTYACELPAALSPRPISCFCHGNSVFDSRRLIYNVGHIYGLIAKPWRIKELRAIIKEGIIHYEKTQAFREPHLQALLKCGVISMEQLESVLHADGQSDKSVAEILVERGIVPVSKMKSAPKSLPP